MQRGFLFQEGYIITNPQLSSEQRRRTNEVEDEQNNANQGLNHGTDYANTALTTNDSETFLHRNLADSLNDPRHTRSSNTFQPNGHNRIFFIDDENEAEELQNHQEWMGIQQRRIMQSHSQPTLRYNTLRHHRIYSLGQYYAVQQQQVQSVSDYQRIGNDRQFRNDDDPVLSTGKLCKYFFTQMSVTIIVLVVFESQTTDPHFQSIESFLIGMCLILVIDLLFFLFKSGTNHGDTSDNFSSNRSSILEIVLNVISGLIYFTMIGWLIYGNYLYFNLPPGNYIEDEPAPEPVADDLEVAVTREFDSNKWLYVSLMSVLTIGYIHLICFIAMVISVITYFSTKLMYNEETHTNRFGHLSPCKMWKFID